MSAVCFLFQDRYPLGKLKTFSCDSVHSFFFLFASLFPVFVYRFSTWTHQRVFNTRDTKDYFDMSEPIHCECYIKKKRRSSFTEFMLK